MKKPGSLFFAFVCLMLNYQCSVPTCAGGSSDHGNSRMAGIIKDDYGNAISGVKVCLIPSEYNIVNDSSAEVMTTVSNDEGCFMFDSIKEGCYCLSGEDKNSRSFLIRTNVKDSDLIVFDSIRLNVPGSIYVDGNSIGLKPGNIAYLKGLKKYCRIDSTGFARMVNVPAGVVSMSGYEPVNNEEIDLGPEFDSLIILPAQTFVSSVSPFPYFVENGQLNIDRKTGIVDSVYIFSCMNPQIKITTGYSFRYFWGDGITSEWTDNPMQIYKWAKPGVYYIQSQVRYCGSYYAWSNPTAITITELLEK